METDLCGSDHYAGAMPQWWVLSVLASFHLPAKRCWLPPFDLVQLCWHVVRGLTFLYHLPALSIVHSFHKRCHIVFIPSTT